jgi:hypothetical protein
LIVSYSSAPLETQAQKVSIAVGLVPKDCEFHGNVQESQVMHLYMNTQKFLKLMYYEIKLLNSGLMRYLLLPTKPHTTLSLLRHSVIG